MPDMFVPAWTCPNVDCAQEGYVIIDESDMPLCRECGATLEPVETVGGDALPDDTADA